MASIITYQHCPACASAKIEKVMGCVDHTVSKEEFEIWECGNCSLRFTQHVPAEDGIGAYYQSDSYISHSDSDQGLINKLYKIVRRYTLGRKREFIQHKTGKLTGVLLDVGCGTGAFLNEMKKVGWTVIGLEPDEKARQKATELYGIKPQTPDQLFNLAAGFYDAITLWHVLEHVHDLQGYLAQLRQLLAPGGKLFIAVPNYTSRDASHYGEYWAAYDVPRHLYHFSPASMHKLAEKNGFKIIAKRPMWADPFYIALLSEQYKNGKGNLLTAIWEGKRSTWKSLIKKEKSSSLIYVLEADAK